ncbi:hypothetical protein C8R44DRAFT_850235 [Mycena epipterygia]|nr:hypothetical protein C8R44DRAFT_850235 [Mycena epipterygia]
MSRQPTQKPEHKESFAREMGKKFADSAAEEAGSQTVDAITGNLQPMLDDAQAQIDDAKAQALAEIDAAKAQAQAMQERAQAELDEKKQQAQDELNAEKEKAQQAFQDAEAVGPHPVIGRRKESNNLCRISCPRFSDVVLRRLRWSAIVNLSH